MEWTVEQGDTWRRLALAAARGRSNPDARRRALDAVQEGRLRLTAELSRGEDGEPLVASLAFRLDVADVADGAGRWSPLCSAGWRVLGLSMEQVTAEAARVREVATAGGDGSVAASSPPDRGYVLDELSELPDVVGP
ncbi:MAG: hypothetical protein L0H84_09230 [Pseudonocardia sp.]|nr:hypothetical protein [Pseudonocardia sp.]